MYFFENLYCFKVPQLLMQDTRALLYLETKTFFRILLFLLKKGKYSEFYDLKLLVTINWTHDQRKNRHVGKNWGANSKNKKVLQGAIATAVFLKIQQIFNEVWLNVKRVYSQLYSKLKFYLSYRYFYNKIDEEGNNYHLMQVSSLMHIRTSDKVKITTFAQCISWARSEPNNSKWKISTIS